jgi:hypothetical protein
MYIYIPAAAMSMSIEGSQNGLNFTCNIPNNDDDVYLYKLQTRILKNL